MATVPPGALDGSPAPPVLITEPQRAVALLEQQPDRVTFEGIALGPGVYLDGANRRIRVREAHLAAVAERMQGVFLRDLHREDMGASVGVVAAARLDGSEVRFTGDIRLAPYVEIVRHFWQHIRFSLGFRYDAAQLVANPDGTHDLPPDFLIDHLALVPQGQYANARLVRLLNQARGLALTEAQTQGRETMSDTSKQDMEQLRLQRDEALRAAERANAGLEQARKEAEQARADLAAATKGAEAARLELGQAKNRIAFEVMKIQMAQGEEFDLERRRAELAAKPLAEMEKLRGDLRLALRDLVKEKVAAAPRPSATQVEDAARAARAQPSGEAMDLGEMSLTDTLRLALQTGVF